MKTTQLILMLIFAGQVAAGPREKRMEGLDLSEEQKTQMVALKEKQQEKLKQARESIMAEGKAEMATFLSAEQMEKMAQMQEHRKQHGQMRKHHKNKKNNKHRKGQKDD